MTTRLLEKDEELALARAWLETGSDRARSALVKAYQPMIRRIARKHMRAGLSLDDLIQEGSIGFMAGLDNFDPARGYSVGTLARFHIALRVRQYAEDNRGVARIPRSRRARERVYRAVSVINEIESEFGVKLTSEEEQLVCEDEDLELSDLHEFRAATACPKIIGSTGDDDESAFDLADETASPEDQVSARQSLDAAREMIAELIAEFPERTRKILVMRHLSDEFVSFDTIASEVGISREMVRRMHHDAIELIRKRLRIRGIRGVDDILA